MTIEQIIAKAERANMSAMVLEMLTAAYEAGRISATQDIVMDMTATDVNNADELAEYAPAVEMIEANYPTK